MKKTQKPRLGLMLAMPLALALAACGGGSSPGASTPDGDGDNTGAAGDDGQSLTVWAWDPAFNIYAMEEAEKIYQQDNPDFTLNIVETPWDDLQPKLTTLAQSQALDELPDIFLMQNNAFQKNVINYPDLFSEISPSAIDFGEFPEAVTAYSVHEGTNYGIPFDSGTAVTALRTDILADAGLTVEDFTDITWDQFIANGEIVLEKTGMAMLSGIAGESDTIMMILQSAGASLFDDDGNPTIADNDALVAAIDVYSQLVEKKIFTEVNSWDEYISTLVTGQVAATINGIWISGSLQTAEDQAGNWSIANLPKVESVPGATNYSANGGSSWAISSTANVDLATDFLAATFGGSKDLYDTILPSSGAVANWIPAGDSDVYGEPQEFFGGQPIYQMVVEYGASVPSNNTGAYYYEGRDAVSTAITQIINGADVTSSLAEAQANVEFEMQ